MSTVEPPAGLVLDRLPMIITLALVLVTAVLAPKLFNTWQVWRIPVVGHELGHTEKRRIAYHTGARRLYNEGYKKFKDSVFRITTSRDADIVVVSPKFLAELKKLPDSVISMEAAVRELIEAKHTGINTEVPIISHTVKTRLTPSLPKLNPILDEEVRQVLRQEIPPTQEWKELNINRALLRIVAMVSGRLFVGPELCRSEEYIDNAINFTIEAMTAVRAVHKIRPWLRPFLAGRLPEVKKLAQRTKEAEEFLKPVIKARQTADDSIEKPFDMLQWVLDESPKFTDKHSRDLAKVQLAISFAAIHTTTHSATNAFYDLAVRPELAAELREEAREALASNNGVFTSSALQSMKKMDSFLKETMRINAGAMSSFQRKVLKTITLSNGQVLPAGVTIEVPAVAVNSDPEVFHNPGEMDPLRFYHLRQEAKERGSVEGSALNQFVSVSQNSLIFGYGRHACPGRFFAANEIKMILANALMCYEFKNMDGFEQRYANLEFSHTTTPDPFKSLLFKELQN